jgi:hypothetical protein
VSRRASGLLVIGLVVGLVAAVAVATIAVTRDGEPLAIAQGGVFSTDAGDPLDVFHGPGYRADGCMNIGGFFYGSSISCTDPATVDETGSWMLVIPELKRKPPLVVGILPANASGATVQVESTSLEATTRGRWFLASLPVGSLGPRNDASVQVAFSS